MQKILKKYLRRLTNLTSRNRSLLLLNLPQEQFLDLHELDFLDGNASYKLINQLISSKKEIVLCEVLDSRFEKVNEVSKRLKKIARTENFIAEERGAKDLYVGYPFVKGKLQDGTIIRCPLLFWAVSLTQSVTKKEDGNSTIRWILQKREDELVSFNRSFLLAYSHFNQIQISDEWLERTFEELDKNAVVFRTQLYELLKESPLTINFNQELFTDQLHFFEKLAKADLELSERNGELKLFPQAVLGIFPQAGSFLVPDYEYLIEEADGEETEDINFEGLFNYEMSDKNVREEDTFLPFRVDASQEAAIKLVKQGKSLVVQGPPGTGKSQLIANLMADFAARGKKVLLVCQKRVALDTVYERLNKAKMTDFVALVHDFKNDRKALFEQLASQIEKTESYKQQNQSLDAIFLERNFTQISRRIDQISKELQEFKMALFYESDYGISAKELYLTSHLSEPYIEVNDWFKSLTFDDLLPIEEKLKQYFVYKETLDGKLTSNDVLTKPIEFWRHRISFSYLNFSARNEIIKTIEQIAEQRTIVKEKTEKWLSKALNIQELRRIDEKKIEEFLQLFTGDLQQIKQIIQFFQANVADKKYLIDKKEMSQFQAAFSQLEEIFAQEGIEKTLPTNELESRKVQFQKALETSQSSFTWLTWKLFSKDKKEVENLLLINKFSLVKADLTTLLKKIENRLIFEKIAQLFAAKNITIASLQEWTSLREILQNLFKASYAYQLFERLPLLKNTVVETTDFRNSLLKTTELITQIKAEYTRWQNRLSEKQIDWLLNENEGNDLIISYLKENFDLMSAADGLKDSFTRMEAGIVERLGDIIDPIQCFQNSFRLAWLNDIEEKYPILRNVSSLKTGQLEKELQECVQKKRELSQEILLLKLRETTYNDLIINRLQNVVSYRELLHQVTKRKKIWSVRKVFEHFKEEIFKLVPCWMASPESVSAIFPMQPELFDLVIFDEASQCYAEQGIPAIYRGKQVAIAGDSKQLQPSDLYQIRYEENTEDEAALEIDSLLELAAQYLSQEQLQGHYRSRSLDLIDFSNRHFYKNTLNLLPDYQEVNKSEPSINYLLVNGIWENNVNQIEAATIIDLIKSIRENQPGKSIGVVTFNYKQATLIEDLLAVEKVAPPLLPATKTFLNNAEFFIKNIENVQGDERDIIIFSIGYAPDAKGRMAMQFGSLNAAAGENRLNVAVTRARDKIYVVSSILPSQLRVEEAVNEGPKLLKKYLEYALQVSEGKYIPRPKIVDKYHFSHSLKSKIQASANQWVAELPFADLTIKNGEKYESLLLTDDDLYYESRSPKEAHAYLPMNLTEKGWVFERLWSRNFWLKK